MVSLGGLSGLSAVYPGMLATQQQQQQNDLQQLQLQDAQAAIAGKAALGRTFQALIPGASPNGPSQPPMQQGPQPPPPGQASQPQQPMMQRPPGPPPMPPQGGGGMPAPQPGMPMGAPAGGAQPPRPTMPPQMQQGAPGGGGGGAPPPVGQFDLKTAAAAIARANPGIDPRTLVEALNQAMPYLKTEAQQEVIQMRQQMQQQNLDVRKDALDARRDALEQQQSQFKDREKRLSDENEAKQGRFDARESRLAAQASVRQDQAWTRLEQQKQQLQTRIAQGDRRASMSEWRGILDAQHKRAQEILSAYSSNSALPKEQRQKLLDEENQAYTDAIVNMRNLKGGAGEQPAKGEDLKPGESRVIDEKRVPVGVPEAFKGDPDGTQYNKNGVTWTKHGDKLVPDDGGR